MRAIRKCVLQARYLPFYLRLGIVVSLFSAQEALIIYFRGWDTFAAILILVGVLTCWLFRWEGAYGILSVFLIVYIVVNVVCTGWSIDAVKGIIAGIIINAALVGSVGALRVTVDRSQEHHQIKDAFIRNLNHELSNHLAAVVGSVDILMQHLGQMSRPECMLFLEQTKYSCDDMERIVSNVCTAMYAEDDVPTPRCEVFRLDHVVQTFLRYVYTFARPLVGVQIQENVVVVADAAQVQQVLRNLLYNAFKYAPSEVPVSIEVGIWNTWFAYVCVRDRGPGIPPEQRSNLFQKFSRTCKTAHGTGLGLYNCRRMIENVGGTIWVESSGVEGEGSSFYFTLPLCQGHNTEIEGQHAPNQTLMF